MSEKRRLSLPDADATTRLGHALADVLGPGDCVCLTGDLGVGKSHLARAVIQARQAAFGPVEDVPSPTYTLVQTYAAGDLEILHADLYRLGDGDELMELGLSDALGSSLCLIEWPEKLGDLAPPDALWITLEVDGPGRVATLVGRGWADRLDAVADAFHG
ncbi:tRNA (adenosine(37)-N6)-threonylcarbamoyltransferase complex ATPase subunit type 1 TsaE [Maribius pontilimi]|uniref:tRNA threonylcarbamoyladenosine biosynthesis protein TsaE n=1 Tax=Palleronia pontilimi TaxID=1964209 RepID=A0A934MFJ7_9RHOB|nr:tRNA (adenosine(37)-N6)-threonylcarbamoyltransferase complex ATPase subunit type 1 TsaE [Palleronia pontilimi]MBJ3761524.1 tRNA (adenosine(37)-N6)-threonylcarbamoyltransferase complex ATPase subunit type 1 TsaE [Palleronia pontilimi]